MESMATKRRQRERHVSIRLSETEAAQLDRVARAAKLGVATWVRRVALLAADREDPKANRRRAAAALAALREGITPEQARRTLEAARRSE